MHFLNYGLAKKGLEKYLKSAVSQCPSTSKMVRTPKHLSNHHSGTFIILSDHR